RGQRPALRAIERQPTPPRELLDDAEADVVAGLPVGGARVAETEDQARHRERESRRRPERAQLRPRGRNRFSDLLLVLVLVLFLLVLAALDHLGLGLGRLEQTLAAAGRRL